jgi:hypothetical protein
MASIFISHSSLGDPYAETVRDEVAAGLERRKHKVLLDKVRLEPGDEWRSVLYQWLAECDGAVVLLNQSAIESDWVAREAAALLWRRELGAPVRIVPVLLGSLGSTSGTRSWYRELMALQAARNDTAITGQADPKALASRIVELFGDVSMLPKDDVPLLTWLEDVADCLTGLPQKRLSEAARHLNVRDEDWRQAWLPGGAEMFLAHQLLARRLDDDVYDAVAGLARAMGSKKLSTLVSLIQPTWVDAEAARQLLRTVSLSEPATATPADHARSEPEAALWAFGIDADLPGTLGTYIQRATCCANSGYQIGTPSGVVGEAVTEELLAQCEIAIRQALHVHRSREKVDENDFNPRRVKRAFLVFDPGIAEPVHIAEVARVLHARYPRLTLLVATGGRWRSTGQPATADLPELCLIEPPLDGELERDGDQLSSYLAGLVKNQASPLAGAA